MRMLFREVLEKALEMAAEEQYDYTYIKSSAYEIATAKAHSYLQTLLGNDYETSILRANGNAQTRVIRVSKGALSFTVSFKTCLDIRTRTNPVLGRYEYKASRFELNPNEDYSFNLEDKFKEIKDELARGKELELRLAEHSKQELLDELDIIKEQIKSNKHLDEYKIERMIYHYHLFLKLKKDAELIGQKLNNA